MSWDRTFQITPYDTVFFRDGRPFQQDDDGLAEAATQFPPTPRTMAGALRAAIGRASGWTEEGGAWPGDKLGNGDSLPNGLRFTGPVPASHVPDTEGLTLWFRAPAFLGASVGEKQAHHFASLTINEANAPKTDFTPTDGSNALLTFPDATPPHKPFAGWLSHKAMLSLLQAGAVPEDNKNTLINSNWRTAPLAAAEPRVGLRRDKARRVADDGKLYQASRMRPHEDEMGRVSLLCAVTSDADLAEPQRIAPLGGDARFAAFETTQINLQGELNKLRIVPEPEKDVIQYVVILITPGELASIKDLPGDRIAICSDRTQVIGGWAMGKPAESVAMLPAGTAVFLRFKGNKLDLEAQLKTLCTKRLAEGARAQLGYGEFVYGRWPK